MLTNIPMESFPDKWYKISHNGLLVLLTYLIKEEHLKESQA